jgi:hypothetical protein
MYKLPEEILNIIFEYGGYKTMFIDKFLYKKIISIRNIFRENPLKINYTLFKWKEKRVAYDNGTLFKHRPSFYCESSKTIKLYEKIPINIINRNYSIIPSKLLKDKIIPLSDTSISYINDCGISKTIYWTINTIKINNIEDGKLYKLVWN